MSEQERRLRALLTAEEAATRSSAFTLETQVHPLVDPCDYTEQTSYLPCYRATVAAPGVLSCSQAGKQPLQRSCSDARTAGRPQTAVTAPTLFPARVRPQFTALQELDLLAIENRAQRESHANAEDAALKARAAKARQDAQTTALAREARRQRQAERAANAAGLQATRRMQEDYATMGRLGR